MAAVKVIVPMDGSQLAEGALNYLPFLANLGSLDVRLVSAVEEIALSSVPGGPELEEKQSRLQDDYLAGEVKRLAAKGIAAERHLRHGNPAARILEEARAWPADFVLLSTHGRSGYQRWHLGSVADKVIRGATCPTLAIGPEPAGSESISLTSVLVPLDGSRLAEAALPLARRLVESAGAKLHIVRVLTVPIYTGDMAGYAWQAGEDATKAYLQEKMKQLATLKPTAMMLTGSTADAVLSYAKQEQISLVVMTSHGHGGFLRLALGSVADRMLGGPAPVLIVPSAEHHKEVDRDR